MKVLPARFLPVTLACGLLLTSTAQARPWAEIQRSGTLRIATEGAFKPFNFYQGGQLTGFEVELGNAIARQLGVKVQWTTQPFDNLLIGLGQNRYDLVIASHGITPERARAVTFSQPHYCTGGVVVSRAGGPSSAATLKGRAVAVQTGTTYLSKVRALPGVTNVRTYPRDTDALQALATGRVDAWVTDRFSALDLTKTLPQAKLKVGSLLFQERNAMAVARGNTTLVKAVNGALATLQKNGTYAKLSRKSFGSDIRCR